MNTVGIFAGRGDVIVAMFLCLMVGLYLGYRLKGWILAVKNRFKGRK